MALLIFYLWQRRLSRNKMFLLVLSFLFWFFHFFYHFSEKPLPLAGKTGEFQIQLYEYPRIDGDRLQASVRNQDGEKWLLVYRIRTEQEKIALQTRIKPGTICIVKGLIEIPRAPTNPNAFDYRLYLRTLGIDYILTGESLDHCVPGKQSLRDYLLEIRKQGIDRIEAHFPVHVAPFITALLFGDAEHIEPEMKRAYQNLGISHLLAISGTHISILTIFLYVLFVRSGFTKEATATFLLIFLPVYSILAGSSPSVNRAVFMSWTILFLSRRRFFFHSLDALGLTYTIFILMNPYILYHVGFQLSYLISAGILLSRRLLHKASHPFVQLSVVSWIAQFLSIPVLLYHFYEFSLLSFFVNLLYVPFYSVLVLPASFVIFLLLLILPQGAVTPFIHVLSFSLEKANELAAWLDSFPRFTVILGKPEETLFLLYCICFLLVFIFLEQGTKPKKLAMLILIPLLLHLLQGKYSPVGEVTVLDIGQGDCIFIRLPFNRGNYLIDTGGIVDFTDEAWRRRKTPFDPGEHIVIPFLKSRGVDHLDKLIITHGDWDHLGSAKRIVSSFPVHEVVTGQMVKRKETEKELFHFLTEKGIPVTEVFRGLHWQEGRYSFYILGPEKNDPSGNDASLVLYTELGGYRWLLTGDIEENGERKLLSTFPRLKADVLKVAHHGSRTSTSTAFLEQVQPEIAIISAGKNNRFGHPHREVLKRLEEHGIHIFRTDLDGAITFSFFRERGKFSSAVESSKNPFQ